MTFHIFCGRIVDIMYIDDYATVIKGKSYPRALLRESFREGKKVNKRTIANLNNCSDAQIQAIKIALKNSDQVTAIKNLNEGKFTQGKSVGSIAMLYQIAHKLGFINALGKSREAVLFLWLVFARLIDQGSRLSAARLGREYAVCEIMGLEKFNENDLYKAMDWGYYNQEKIESKLFSILNKNKEKSNKKEPYENVFLYDVTSSYLEGNKNELAEYGYNRDKKIGKRQIVCGLLTDEDGIPLSIEAFAGNTSDNKTLKSQIIKLKERFGCKYVTIVGDKGMIKRMQIESLNEECFNYITSITKPQIRELLKREVIQMGLFEEHLFEVFDEEKGIRYILRRNKRRAEEMKQTRESKLAKLGKKVEFSNRYLSEHRRAKVETQLEKIRNYLQRSKLCSFVEVSADAQTRRLCVELDKAKLDEFSELDGCYVIKTDLEKSKSLKKEIIHERYKSLSQVEWAFRTSKTGYLEVRPVYVRRERRTRAHLLITMLSYRLEKFLRKYWRDIDLTVEEGIKKLGKITTVIIEVGNERLQRVPIPDKKSKELLEVLGVKLPHVIPLTESKVDTKTKLINRRKQRS